MPSLSETFEAKVTKPDSLSLAEQRVDLIHGLFAEVDAFNQALEAINSGSRFILRRAAGGLSVAHYELRHESGIATGKASFSTSRMLELDFAIRRAEIVVGKQDYGEAPHYKSEPDDIIKTYSYDAFQAVKDYIADEIKAALSENDIYDLKFYFANQRQEQAPKPA